MTSNVYISGTGCLSPCGLNAKALLQALVHPPEFTGAACLGRLEHEVCFGGLPDFSDVLAGFVSPLKRRKMSRLSRMAVAAAGLTLHDAGLGEKNERCGVILGTGFGSTSQSVLFYRDMIASGFPRANPGLFPETVPNSPAGQVSLTFGLRGPNTTICQQSISSELALMTGFDFIRDGKLDQVLVIGIEEMSDGLLSGLWSCGVLQKRPQSLDHIPLGQRMLVGEGAYGLVLESEDSLHKRGGSPLARLDSVHAAGAARWPATYHDIDNGVASVVRGMNLHRVDCVIPSASFIASVDRSHVEHLATALPREIPMLMPEYHTGAVLGAGLLKQVLAVSLLGQEEFRARELGSAIPVTYGELYPRSCVPVSTIYTSAVTAGGGCASTVIQRVN